MDARRELIVVSNRGPVTFGRDASGNRVARRGGGGLVTALRSLVTHHDVTWVASAISDEDRLVALEAGTEALAESAADGSPYRLRLVAHDVTEYDRYYNVVSNPMLWFVQHYLWSLTSSPNVGPGLHTAWTDGYVPVNQRFADAVLDELDRRPDATVFFHDYHLYVAPGMVREGRPEATLAHFVHVPWAQPDYWRVLPEPIRRAIHEGILANDVVGFHTDRWRRNFLRSCVDIAGAAIDISTGMVRLGEREICARVAPISVDPLEFETLARSERVLAEEEAIASSRCEFLLRPRRPHGSVEERRPRLRRLRAVSRVASGAARARRHAGAARPVAAGHPGVRGVPRRHPARRPRRQRPLPAQRLAPARPADPGQLPAGGGGLQAVRRAARERDLRRHEPRREGGPARQRARRRPRSLGERRRARRACPLGADGQPVRRRRAGRGDLRGTDHAGRGEATPRRGDPRAGACARHRGLDRAAARRRRRGRRGSAEVRLGREPTPL